MRAAPSAVRFTTIQESDMSRQRRGLVSKLAAVGAVGAAAGLAWRWAQRHQGAGGGAPRELNRWEGEGGALVTGGEHPPGDAITDAERAATASPPNGALSAAWPFPHSSRH